MAGGAIRIAVLMGVASLLVPQTAARGAPSGNSAPPTATTKRTERAAVKSVIRNTPPVFEPNIGQVLGSGGKAVKFVLRRPGFTAFLLGNEIVIKLKNRAADWGSRIQDSAPEFAATKGPQSPKRRLLNHKSPAHVLRLRLAGANPRAAAEGLDPPAEKRNYLIGNDPSRWRCNVPVYGRVKFRNLYPGIDEVFYGSDGRLEFDFIIHPGADARSIRFSGRSANSKLSIAANGDLLITTAAGEIRLGRPMVYERNVEGEPWSSAVLNSEPIRHGSMLTSARYVLTAGNEIRFALPDYDGTKTFVIDPVLSYSTYLGGSGYDVASAIAVDTFGRVYVTGQTDSLDFPAPGGAQPAIGDGMCGPSQDAYPCFDAFITKLSADGSSVVYSTYLGGSGDDRGTGIAVDSSGNAYVTGITNSVDFPVVNAIQQNPAGGDCGASSSPTRCFDSFVVKLSQDGSSIAYSTYLGGTGQDLAAGIAVDPADDATVAGSTSSPDFPVAAGAPQNVYGGGTLDAFVTRLSASGTSLLFSSYLGGSDEDRGLAVAVDAAGDAFIAGSTASNDFPAVNGVQSSNAGGVCGSTTSSTPCTDTFITRLDPSGNRIAYSTYLGGTGGEAANAIAVDTSGIAYVAGSTTSTDFPVTSLGFQQAGGGTSVDAFVSKISPDGSALDYSTYLGAIGQEAAYGIAVDLAGNAYVTGYVNDSGFPLVRPFQDVSGGFNDAYVAKLNAEGSALVFSSFLGGSGYEAGEGIAVDAAGNAYLAGWTFSSDFPTRLAPAPSYAGGSYDAFVASVGGLGPGGASLSAAGLTFQEQGVATDSPAQTVLLSNAGQDALSLMGIAASGDFSQTSNCAGTLAPGTDCDIDVVFSPASTGARTGTLTVNISGASRPLTAALAGNGVPAFSLSAAPEQATVVMGTDSASFTISAESPYAYAQFITLDCDGETNVQCSFDPAVITPGTTSVLTVGDLAHPAASSFSFDIKGTSAGQFATVPVTVIFSDFTISAPDQPQTVVAGKQATFDVVVQPMNGFNQAISMDCSGAPALATCRVVPSSVTPNGDSASKVSVVVATAASAFMIPPSNTPIKLGTRLRWAWLVLVVTLGFLLRPNRRIVSLRHRSVLCCLELLVVMLWAGCGGGGNAPTAGHPGTPAGKYQLTIRGTSGPIVRSAKVELQVK